MFIYQGKLNWYNYAVGETFTIIFPKGVVRANDPVYIYTQWTKDASGVEKSKFFQTILVQDLKQLPKSTDVTFTLSGAWYNYAITTEQNYSKIKVEMTSPSGGKASTALERHWQPQGEINPNAALRIWAGSINWRENAVNEQAIFVLPEDYEDGKPVVSSWQWTKDGSGNAKTSAFKGTNMKVVGSDDKFDKFSFNNFFDITCAWNKETQKLGIEVKADGKQASIGELNLVAKIEPKAHSFDSDDLVPPTRKETDFRLPQPVQTLPRVLDPMPFPKTILETLTHGVAFIEQAGYLTAQAQNRFAALDADFHKQTVLVETLKKDKQNLEGQITSLTGERNQARSEVEELNKQIKDNTARHQKRVDELLLAIDALKNHDLKDHGDMNKLKEDISELHRKNMILNEKLASAQIEKKRLDAQIKGLREQVATLESKRVTLQNELNTQKAQNVSLRSEVLTLKRKLSESHDANAQLQKKFAASESELRDTKAKLTAALQRANKAEDDLKTRTGERDQLQKDFDTTDGYYQKEKVKSQKLHDDYDTAYHQVQDYQNTVEEWQRVVRNKKINFPEVTKINEKFVEIRNRV
ncbi:hypothetical protein FPCIR_5197 [Fusarium pseudocircinatum]|uniref:Uncharacterized protein n=1 Tax=Fusarium pseudocircinatum TaxID=56676 RepID=A0A8H5PBE1_9HYPO|nr:hypothetical protein FPCIR_5197 [Fusarium pseudocircinatum]